MSDSLYREIILDHYKHPHNFGNMEDPDAFNEESNPTCGDKVKYYIKVKGDKIDEIKFIGRGCAISMASSSILSDLVKGMTVEQVMKLSKEDVLENLGTPSLGPNRIKCALLPLKVLQATIVKYISGRK